MDPEKDGFYKFESATPSGNRRKFMKSGLSGAAERQFVIFGSRAPMVARGILSNTCPFLQHTCETVVEKGVAAYRRARAILGDLSNLNISGLKAEKERRKAETGSSAEDIML